MTSIAQPLTGLSTQCKLPITVPQAMGLMQQAQGAGGRALPASPALPALPGGGANAAAGAVGPSAAVRSALDGQHTSRTPRG